MKIVKRLLTCIILVTMILNAVNVFAQKPSMDLPIMGSKIDKDIYYAKCRAEVFLAYLGQKQEVNNITILMNLMKEREACLFELSKGGYIIVNINDLSVPEFAPDGLNPYCKIDNPIYNGPLNYYKEENGKFINIADNSEIDTKAIFLYHKVAIENKEDYINTLIKKLQNNTKAVSRPKYIPGRLETWSYNTDGFCGALACAICMRYYNDYVDYRYVDIECIEEIPLTELMRTYVGYYGTEAFDLTNGLNRYLSSRGVNNRTNYTNGFSFLKIKSSINLDRPAILSIRSHPRYRNHWVVAYGYLDNTANGQYVIVNDGWGSINVWLAADATFMDRIVYFSE